MTTFIHVDQATHHPGVDRAERAYGAVRQLARAFDGTRGTASLMLAAVVAALMTIANQVIDTWTEGHLLAAWIVMWAVAFAALALLAVPARRTAERVRAGLQRWSAARRQAELDDKLWQVALTDARVMADLSRAMSQHAQRDVREYY